MFDLEQSIAEWRQQMLAAGIKTPAPLEELESHLREEIERQIQSGASAQEAFRRTVLQIGQPKELKAEFARAGNFLPSFGNDKLTIMHRILGTLWLALCSLAFFEMSREFISRLTAAHVRLGPADFLLALPLIAIYGAGILGSVLLIRGLKPGRWIVGTIAIFFTLFAVCILARIIPTSHPFSVLKVAVFTAFYAITACLMFLPSYPNIKPAGK